MIKKELFLKKVEDKKRKLPLHRIIKHTDSFFMFFSKGEYVNLNGEKLDKNGQKIVCRHFAAAQILHEKNNFFNYHEAFTNPTDISFLYENKFDKKKILSTAESYYLFNVNNIGQTLSQLSARMQRNTVLPIIWMSVNHAMSIKIKCKEKDDVILQFYDPNYTLRHIHVWFPDIESISTLLCSDLLDERHLNAYFPQLAGFLAVNPQTYPINIPRAPYYNIDNDVQISEQLYFGLVLWSAPWVSSIMQTILASNIDNEQKVSLLSGKRADGTPGLFLALQEGHHPTVTDYVQLILESSLNNEQKINLLACRLPNGTPGFNLALVEGHHLAVIQYAKLILDSNLEHEQKADLLSGKRADGVPGLHFAFQNDHHQLISEYTELILNSDLSDEQKVNLLDSKRADGYTGLFVALQGGHHQTVGNYLKSILASSLNHVTKESLLACFSPSKTPGLFMAFQLGHHQTVKIYVQFILASNLSYKQKKKILACRELLNEEVPGLFIALQLGHFQTVENYIKAILDSDFSNEQKEDLLACKTVDEVPGLFTALQNGHHQTVESYTRLVMNSNLDEKQKLSLLTCKRDGLPGIFMAIIAKNDSTVAIYFNEISNQTSEFAFLIIDELLLDLNKIEKTQLLQTIERVSPVLFLAFSHHNGERHDQRSINSISF